MASGFSFLHGNRKILDRVWLGGRRCLLTAGKFLHSLGDVKVEHVNRNPALALVISTTCKAFNQRLGEGAVIPLCVFQRILITG